YLTSGLSYRIGHIEWHGIGCKARRLKQFKAKNSQDERRGQKKAVWSNLWRKQNSASVSTISKQSEVLSRNSQSKTCDLLHAKHTFGLVNGLPRSPIITSQAIVNFTLLSFAQLTVPACQVVGQLHSRLMGFNFGL